MAPTVINIQGSATLRRPAEIAVLNIEVSSSGKDQPTASRNVIQTVNNLQSILDAASLRTPPNNTGDSGSSSSSSSTISPTAPISFYSIASLSTSSSDELDKDSLPTGSRIYTATTSIEIHFRSFATLGTMVVQFSSIPFVSLQGISWKLTDEVQAELEEQARTDALRHAIARARNYAQVIDRNTVTPVKIQDSQQYLFFEGRARQAAFKVADTASFGIGVGIDFEPQVIEVKANLEVEFHAE